MIKWVALTSYKLVKKKVVICILQRVFKDCEIDQAQLIFMNLSFYLNRKSDYYLDCYLIDVKSIDLIGAA